MTKGPSLAPTIRLMNGVEMPAIGFGTWPLKGAEAVEAVGSAISTGYRLIDTAENYRNEEAVGEAMRKSGVPRDQLFLTTKFNKEWHSVGGVRETCEASLKRLGLDYIDLLLVHWPNPGQDRYCEAVDGMSRLLDAGLLRAIGVSNFKPAHLQKLFDAGLVPHVNQIQLDPYHRRDDIVAIDQDRGIVTEAWSPLGKGTELLSDAAVTGPAEAHGVTPAQVVLRWHVQSGYLPIPKSANPKRQAENLDVFSFELTKDEMNGLNRLHRPDATMMDADSFGH